MKTKIAVIFLLCTALISCNENNLLDPNAMISLRQAPGAQHYGLNRRAGVVINDPNLSAYDIVVQTANLEFMYQGHEYGRGFSWAQRDTITPMLKMWGFDVIDADGNIVEDFITAEDAVLQRVFVIRQSGDTIQCIQGNGIYAGSYDSWLIDTIAYIPNATLRAAEIAIREAHAKKDYETVYNLFNTAFTFRPITGPAWRELKAAGLQ